MWDRFTFQCLHHAAISISIEFSTLCLNQHSWPSFLLLFATWFTLAGSKNGVRATLHSCRIVVQFLVSCQAMDVSLSFDIERLLVRCVIIVMWLDFHFCVRVHLVKGYFPFFVICKLACGLVMIWHLPSIGILSDNLIYSVRIIDLSLGDPLGDSGLLLLISGSIWFSSMIWWPSVLCRLLLCGWWCSILLLINLSDPKWIAVVSVRFFLILCIRSAWCRIISVTGVSCQSAQLHAQCVKICLSLW